MATEFISNSWLMPTNANAEANRVSNYSLDFDGTSQYISINSSILSAAGDMTVSAWVKFNDTTSLQGIFESANYYTTGFNGGFGLRANGIGLSAAFSNGTSFDYNIEPAGFTIGNWFHVAFTFNNTSKLGTYYVDGSSIGTYTFNSAYDNADLVNGAELGRVIKNSGFILNGNLTEVSIFDYELSAPQVTELYGTGSAIGNPMAITNGRKPVAYYPLGNSAFNSEFLVPNGAEQDFVFDFTADYIDANSASYLNAVSNFTISTWFTTDTVAGADKFLINIGSSSSELWGVQLYQGDLIVYGGSSAKYFRYNGHIAIGQWYNLVVLYNGNESASDRYKVYLNGSLLSTSSTSGTVPTVTPSFTTNLVIGKLAYAAAAYWNGKMSNASVFNTALPATGTESVASLYNYGTPPNIASYSGLQGWWELDASATFDGSNWSIPDASSNSNTGTSSGMTAANLILSDLIINQSYDPFSLSFDGTNDFIDLGSNISQSFSELSISTWINVDSSASGAYDTIIRRGTWLSGAFELRNNASYAGLKFAIYPGTANVTTTGVTLNDGKWHHISVTYDGTNVKIYVDGSLNNSTTNGTGATGTSTQITTIAASDQGTSRYYEGKISNVSIYNSELSATQVTTLYNEGKPFDLNNFAVTPVSWWRLGSVNSSYNSTSSEWTILDEIGTNNGTGSNLGPAQTALSDGVGATGSGLSSGMSSGTNRTGDAPYSENNAVSYNMSVTAKSTSVPT